MNKNYMVFGGLLLALCAVLIIGFTNQPQQADEKEAIKSLVAPLQYVAIIIEALIATAGLVITVRHKRPFGYGIFLTFTIYVFYDLARLTATEISDAILYPMFFIATLSMLWAVILLYKEKTHAHIQSKKEN